MWYKRYLKWDLIDLQSPATRSFRRPFKSEERWSRDLSALVAAASSDVGPTRAGKLGYLRPVPCQSEDLLMVSTEQAIWPVMSILAATWIHGRPTKRLHPVSVAYKIGSFCRLGSRAVVTTRGRMVSSSGGSSRVISVVPKPRLITLQDSLRPPWRHCSSRRSNYRKSFNIYKV